MKSLKIYGSFLLALIASTQSFAQEQVLASAQIAANPTEKPAATAAAADVEEEKKAEEEEPKLTFSGSVDTYFHTSFGHETIAPGTSFGNLKGFGLGMFNLIATYATPKAGATADIVFGPRGRDAVFANLYSNQRIINQLYVYYKLSDKVTLNMGQFNTFVGYEVISPTVNFHYSTSYMFSYGPFNHTGMRADFTLKNGWVAKLAVMNPTDLVEFNPVNTYSVGGQIGYTNDRGGIWFNVLDGDQDGTLDKIDLGDDGYSEGNTLQLDLTTGWNITDAFYLGANATYRTVSKGEQKVGDVISKVDEDAKGFMGLALYPKVTLSETFALGLRAEYFQIYKGYLATPDGAAAFSRDEEGTGNVINLTLSANYKVGGLMIIPEFRLDSTLEDTFQKKSTGPLTKTLPSFTLAAVYKF